MLLYIGFGIYKEMIKIAIVENSPNDSLELKKNLEAYSKKYNQKFEYSLFVNALLFLKDYKSEYDIVFMDIDMPHMDGLEAARKLREIDKKVVLIFITNLAQYAIKGYSVNAFDFIAKPVSYYNFETMLNRAIVKCNYEKKTEITINTTRKIIKLDLLEIIYIEVSNHRLTYNADSGKYECWGSLKNIEDSFLNNGFAKANSSCLVNLRRVQELKGSEVKLDNGAIVYLSRGLKKDFYKCFAQFTFGENN